MGGVQRKSSVKGAEVRARPLWKERTQLPFKVKVLWELVHLTEPEDTPQQDTPISLGENGSWRAREAAQLAECFSSKQEDLSVLPRTHIHLLLLFFKTRCVGVCCHLSPGELETGPAAQPTW